MLALGGAAWFLWPRTPEPAPPAAAAKAPAPEAGQRPRVNLPADDGVHRNFMEWWYFNGHLRAADGRAFSYHYVFFFVNSVVPYTAAQLSLTDHQTGKRFVQQKGTPGNPSANAARGFNFVLGDWVMAGSDGTDYLKASAADFAFELRLTNPGPTVYQGGTGWLDFGEAGWSYYYSRPRMKSEGSLTVLGQAQAVTGESWFDHQWGDFRPLALGWDWFALQLDDGADVMLYQLWDAQGRLALASGTYTKDGATRVLQRGDFSVTPTASWTSRATGTRYNTAWKVAIPAHGIAVDAAPVVQDAEVDGRDTTLLVYWEGAVRLAGSHRGRGFIEICPLKAPPGAK
jgi:predicted secreted hydrolase